MSRRPSRAAAKTFVAHLRCSAPESDAADVDVLMKPVELGGDQAGRSFCHSSIASGTGRAGRDGGANGCRVGVGDRAVMDGVRPASLTSEDRQRRPAGSEPCPRTADSSKWISTCPELHHTRAVW